MKYFRKLLIYLNEIKRNFFLRKKIINYYSKKEDCESREIFNNVKNNLFLRCFYFVPSKNNNKISVFYDDFVKLHYVLKDNKKLFFPRTFSKGKIKRYYSTILNEQDRNSPHLYLTETLLSTIKDNNLNNILIECGAAEASFSLDVVDYYKEVYIIESNCEWIEPLKATFANYHNVKIINKYVSSKDDNNQITLDSLIKNKHKMVDMIKMDIEGAELQALIGSENILKESTNIKLLISVYHNEEDENNIRKYLSKFGFDFYLRNGYIIFKYDKKIKEPFIRNCLLECIKKN